MNGEDLGVLAGGTEAEYIISTYVIGFDGIEFAIVGFEYACLFITDYIKIDLWLVFKTEA